jgi:hypothetical protein
MSYILDAIRKAEKQRLDESVPSLEAMVGERRRRGPQRPWGRWLLILTVLLVVSAVFFYRAEAVHFGKRAVASAKFRAAHLYKRLVGDDQNSQRSKNKANTDAVASGNTLPIGGADQSANANLTDAQRRLIDSLKISVISYSKDNDKRFLMVDADVLREGDRLLNFPILRIQQDGVIIDVNGASVLVRP